MIATAVRPSFFVIGAPRCGTTALHSCLQQVPGLFLPGVKELNHFADDLLPPDDPWRDEERWLGLFAPARPDQIAGETSAYHLLSHTAPDNVHAFDPGARIVAMVRHPVEMLRSLHERLVYNGDEPLTDLHAALDAEPARRRGEGIPAHIRFPHKLWYSEAVRLGTQIERWRARFPDLMVVVHEDFARDPDTVTRAVLRHVGGDPSAELTFGVVNAGREVRSRWLQRQLLHGSRLARCARALLPQPVARGLARGLHRWNRRRLRRAPVDRRTHERVCALCGDEVHRLAALLGRDLDHWLEPPGGAP